ncbi:hypothetical protein [Rhizobium leguminosarum]|nr:hypothetical protein [Rhizobium leguminosarum]MBA9033906.1 hypothetical protein [Rhizobium leguminosarum]MDI5927203.1 hypothetical protein [Rhizobium leguminosarum]
MTWLDDHGRTSRKPRPDHEIETNECDIARFEAIKAPYLKAIERKGKAA